MSVHSPFTRFTALALGTAFACSTPALAHGHGGPDHAAGADHAAADADGRVFEERYPEDSRPEWRGPAAPAMRHPAPGYGHGGYDQAGYDQAREAWLSECRRNQRGRDRDGGLGGAAIGGVLGGVVGNRVAGRGDRLIGTVAGAAIGAAAGAAIDRADGAGRARDMDYCERYLAQYSGGYGQGHGQPGYGYTYAVPMMMVPVAVQQQAQPCTETIVTEEYVTTAPRRRVAPRRVYYAPVRDKRVRIAPAPSGKRVRTY